MLFGRGDKVEVLWESAKVSRAKECEWGLGGREAFGGVGGNSAAGWAEVGFRSLST